MAATHGELRGTRWLGVPVPWRQRWVLGNTSDAAIAVALVVLAFAILALSDPESGTTRRDADILAYALAALMTLPLAARRRWPFAALAAVAAGSAGMVVYGARDYAAENVDFVGPVFMLYLLAAQGPRWQSLLGAAMAAAAVVTAFVVNSSREGGSDYLSVVIIVGGLWLMGDAARQRRVLSERLAAQGESLRAARLELAHQAVTEERLRIARELHDVVGHHLSVVAVQAEVALDRLTADPDAAGRALHEVAATARGALGERRAAHWVNCAPCWDYCGQRAKAPPRSTLRRASGPSTSSTPTSAKAVSSWTSPPRVSPSC